MPTLAEALQQTITNLEKIRDSQKPPSDELLTKLDTLFSQQEDLIGAAIEKATVEYASATTSMNEAATKTQEARDDLSKVDQAIEKVADAIGKVVKLLAAVA